MVFLVTGNPIGPLFCRSHSFCVLPLCGFSHLFDYVVNIWHTSLSQCDILLCQVSTLWLSRFLQNTMCFENFFPATWLKVLFHTFFVWEFWTRIPYRAPDMDDAIHKMWNLVSVDDILSNHFHWMVLRCLQTSYIGLPLISSLWTFSEPVCHRRFFWNTHAVRFVHRSYLLWKFWLPVCDLSVSL